MVVDGPDGAVAHAELAYSGAMIMLGTARPPGADEYSAAAPPPGGSALYLAVEDPDAHHERAREAGAEIVRALADTEYGSREYSARDPEGNVWSFGDVPAVARADLRRAEAREGRAPRRRASGRAAGPCSPRRGRRRCRPSPTSRSSRRSARGPSAHAPETPSVAAVAGAGCRPRSAAIASSGSEREVDDVAELVQDDAVDAAPAVPARDRGEVERHRVARAEAGSGRSRGGCQSGRCARRRGRPRARRAAAPPAARRRRRRGPRRGRPARFRARSGTSPRAWRRAAPARRRARRSRRRRGSARTRRSSQRGRRAHAGVDQRENGARETAHDQDEASGVPHHRVIGRRGGRGPARVAERPGRAAQPGRRRTVIASPKASSPWPGRRRRTGRRARREAALARERGEQGGGHRRAPPDAAGRTPRLRPSAWWIAAIPPGRRTRAISPR